MIWKEQKGEEEEEVLESGCCYCASAAGGEKLISAHLQVQVSVCFFFPCLQCTNLPNYFLVGKTQFSHDIRKGEDEQSVSQSPTTNFNSNEAAAKNYIFRRDETRQQHLILMKTGIEK